MPAKNEKAKRLLSVKDQAMIERMTLLERRVRAIELALEERADVRREQVLKEFGG
jgi:hypothetical protein